MEEETNSLGKNGIPMLHFSVQLQNVVITEIVAKRFPVDAGTYKPSDVETLMDLEGISVDIATSIAQAILSIKTSPKVEPRLFEISFKLVGLFTYSKDYSPEMVHTFLEYGSLSVMLPFAREMLTSLCTRLQLPLILLPMVPIASTPTSETPEEGVRQNH
jgi:preprotein translocase subunit SecB